MASAIEEVFTAGTVSHQPDTDLDGVQQGRIVEEWERYDNLTMLQQLGLLPEG